MIKRLLTASTLTFLAATASSQDYETEIRTIAGRGDLQRAFSIIESTREQFVEQLIELTQLPAPPFKEEKRAARFAELMREAGLSDVSIDDVGNVLARRPGDSEEVVAVVAHLDTVFPEGTDVTVVAEKAAPPEPNPG